MRDQVSQTIRSFRGVHFRKFNDSPEFVRYLADRIVRAKRSVDDLTWIREMADERQGGKAIEADKRYHDAIVAAANNIVYKEIFMFTDQPKIEKLKYLIEKDPRYYRCGYFDNSEIPRPAFIIIDREEVLLYATPHIFCSIRHPELTEAFNHYFSALWNKATKIKDGRLVNKQTYDNIIARASPQLTETVASSTEQAPVQQS